MQSLRDRVVLVTGAGGNLGVAISATFERSGARLVLVERSLEHLREQHAARADSPSCLLLEAADLTDESSAKAMVADAIGRFGRVDVLVHTIGAYRAGKPVHEEDLETWDFLFRLNVRTALLACRAVLPGMLERRHGRIVSVASRDALAGVPGAAAYSASKAALLRLTESLAEETRGHGITVNCVLPGTIDTPQNRAALPEDQWTKLVPADAIADVIELLVSDAARAVSGAAIPVLGVA